MADPQDIYALDELRLATGREVRPNIALRSEIDDLIERWHGQGRSAMGAIVETAERETATRTISNACATWRPKHRSSDL